MAVHSKFRSSCHLDPSIQILHDVSEINIISFFQIIVRKWVKKFCFYSIKHT